MLRVIHIITGLDDGGAEAVLYRLCVHSAGNQLSHSVVSLTGSGKYGPMLESAGIPVLSLGMPRGRLTFASIALLHRHLRSSQADIVQTWMYHANLVGGVLALTSGHRRVSWGLHHTDLVATTVGPSTRFVSWLCARLSRVVPVRIVACANSAQEVHVNNGYEPSRFVLIPNGYDILKFAPLREARSSVRRRLSIRDDVPLLGLVGRWDPQKDHSNLLAALAGLRDKCPEATLLLVGTGCDPKNADLVEMVADFGLQDAVRLLGRRNDIPSIMNALDLHVLSSQGEAFPNVVAEAMACGTPCVVTDVGDAADIVGDTGWVVPSRNAKVLAEAMEAALTEKTDRPTDWTARQRAARQRIVDNYSIETMVERYVHVWRSMLEIGGENRAVPA